MITTASAIAPFASVFTVMAHSPFVRERRYGAAGVKLDLPQVEI